MGLYGEVYIHQQTFIQGDFFFLSNPRSNRKHTDILLEDFNGRVVRRINMATVSNFE